MTWPRAEDTSELTIPWASAQGGQDLADWIDSRLAKWSLRRAGQLEQVHLRPWSTVIRVPLESGSVFAKASAPALRYEAALTQWLADRHPDDVIQVLATNSDQGWLLLQDGGARLRQELGPADGLEVWDPILRRYAALQMRETDSATHLLALKVPDRRPVQLPDLMQALIAALPGWGNEDEPPLAEAELAQLEWEVDNVRQRADRLSDFPIKPTVEHGDLHDGNVFAMDGGYRFFDWGDGSISHPFFSLRVTYVSAEFRFDIPEADARLDRLRQQYLAAWQAQFSVAKLEQAFALARSIWALPAALRWQLALRDAAVADRVEYAAALPSLMRELLNDLEVSRD